MLWNRSSHIWTHNERESRSVILPEEGAGLTLNTAAMYNRQIHRNKDLKEHRQQALWMYCIFDATKWREKRHSEKTKQNVWSTSAKQIHIRRSSRLQTQELKAYSLFNKLKPWRSATRSGRISPTAAGFILWGWSLFRCEVKQIFGWGQKWWCYLD